MGGQSRNEGNTLSRSIVEAKSTESFKWRLNKLMAEEEMAKSNSQELSCGDHLAFCILLTSSCILV